MKQFVTLLVLIGATMLVTLAQGIFAPTDAGTRVIFSIGMLLLGAWLIGEVFEKIRLPRISGYLATGIVIGPHVTGLINADQFDSMRFANDLAISLIALTAGGEIDFKWLKNMARRLLILIGVDVAIVITLGGGAVLIASMIAFGEWELAPFIASQAWDQRFVIALLMGTVMIANSPAVVIAMVSDYNARGPLSQTALALTVLKDLVLIIMFATVLAISRAVVEPDQQLNANFLIGVSVQLLGSAGLGGLIGLLMALYVHKVKAHLIPFSVGVCMLIALLSDQEFYVMGQDVHLEALLIALTAGILMRNVWSHESEPLFETIEDMSLPVYCLFFALAGAGVHLNVFEDLTVVLLVVLLVLVRVGAIFCGVQFGCYVAKIKGDAIRWLWLGMIPQAGVSIVLVTLIAKAFSGDDSAAEWGVAIKAVLIGMIVIHESLGPIGFRYALKRAGEINKDDSSS